MERIDLFNKDSSISRPMKQVNSHFIKYIKKNLQKGLAFTGTVALSTIFLATPSTANAATNPLAKTNYSVTMSANKVVTVKLKLNTTKKVTVKKGTNVVKIQSAKQSGKTITVKLKVAKAGTCKLKVSGKGLKANTAKVKVKKAKADNGIGDSVSVDGYNIQLGMSKESIKQAMAVYGEPAYEGTNNGCQSYATDCIYYQKDGCATSFMFEFYNGTLDRVLFSSPTWKIGTLNNGTKSGKLSLGTHSYRTESGSATSKWYTETKGNNVFTMYLDNPSVCKGSAGWYLCELKSKADHSGTNPLASQTIPLTFDLSKYDVNSNFQKKFKNITKDKVIQECKNMNALDLEKGKQNIYLTNMYRAYHGGELAAYSDLTSQYAYVNAKVRSMAGEDYHASFFEGEFSNRALQNTIKSVRLNEWWNDWQETYSENCGYEGGADAVTVLAGTVASTAHLENVLRGNFAMGAAIVSGYDTVETISASRMSDDEIKEAQQRFTEKFSLSGVSANEVEPALYMDSYASFTYNYLYHISTTSKTDWINYVVKQCGLTTVKGATEYVGARYDEYYNSARDYVYDGKDVFYSIYLPRVDQDYMTQSQLEAVYTHFCSLEYDQEFTQALMKYFSCTAEQVYLDHSDIVVELAKTPGRELEYKVSDISTKYNTPLKSTVNMIVKAHTSYNAEGKAEALDYLYNYFGIN